ncbi:unnamed protein product [Soboliphyme baturini]|uniref:AcidPPc domain-containing protein n=1 Tax=Soboliphyme baturini TaxID=241478 RepID=A0A183IDA4_9BILA|nr:unnamed protein product [Soboliphyme baturini]
MSFALGGKTVFPYNQRVFWCRDESLLKPNLRPHNFIVYVSYDVLYCVSFIVPAFVILIGELMFWLFSTKPRKTVLANCRECKVHLFVRRLLRFISVFMFGMLIVFIFTQTIKLMTGFQRPYFLTLCQPNFNSFCQAPYEVAPYPSPYAACLNQDENELRVASLSFPSLHAALSSFAAIFTSCYIHYMVSLRGAPLLRPFLIFGFLGMCMIASFAPVQGYKNHWVDVWFGWLLGGITAIYLCHNVLCFQELYSLVEVEETMVPQERISPFFSWFRLPRVHAKEPAYSVYGEDTIQQLPTSDSGTQLRNRTESRPRDNQRTYEVTTTTESFQRTIVPPQSGISNLNNLNLNY